MSAITKTNTSATADSLNVHTLTHTGDAAASNPLFTKQALYAAEIGLRAAWIAATPTMLCYFGGPKALWNNSGCIVRPIIVIFAVPAAFNGVGAFEGVLRAAYGVSKAGILALFGSYDHAAAALDVAKDDAKTAAGLTIATMYPLAGYATMINNIDQFMTPKERRQKDFKVLLEDYHLYYAACWAGKKSLQACGRGWNITRSKIVWTWCKIGQGVEEGHKILDKIYVWDGLRLTATAAFWLIRKGVGILAEMIH